ncbi:MAG: hypothetical protein HRT53_20780 [Colwellia sp.]|nr:hypothetical protein [Colwellia sp.]
MDKCTQNLVSGVITTVLNNVNNAICFYTKRPSLAMRLSLEETVTDNLSFAELVKSNSAEGKRLLEKLNKLNDCLINRLPIFPIDINLSGEQS